MCALYFHVRCNFSVSFGCASIKLAHTRSYSEHIMWALGFAIVIAIHWHSFNLILCAVQTFVFLYSASEKLLTAAVSSRCETNSV